MMFATVRRTPHPSTNPANNAQSIFGMNVDVLSNNPPWFWFLVFLLPMCAAIVLVWLLFKYVPVRNYAPHPPSCPLTNATDREVLFREGG